jgi:hypothetical protein
LSGMLIIAIMNHRNTTNRIDLLTFTNGSMKNQNA